MITVKEIARKCHEANKAYCEIIGDMSQPSWDDAPDWQKNSAINGVEIHLNDETMTGEDSHSAWSQQKLEEGWTYGKKKDPVKKTHPCLVPYEELPVEQRVKDIIFKVVVDALRRYAVR